MVTLLLCSVSGAPGVSVAALGLAACWPAEGIVGADGVGGPVVAEADPAGGVIAARFGLGPTPGLLGLARDARRLADPHLVTRHTQLVRLADRAVEVVVAPPGWAKPAAALPAVCGPDGPLVRHARPVVIIDGGRLVPGSPVWPLVSAVDMVLLVAPGRAEAVTQVAAALPEIVPAAGSRVGLLLGHGGTHPAREVSEALGVPVVAELPVDRRGAAVLSGVLAPSRRWRRLRLPAALGRTAAWLTVQLNSGPQPRRVPEPRAPVSPVASAPPGVGLPPGEFVEPRAPSWPTRGGPAEGRP